ncbi:muscleblind-like protein isoform X5 [Periplaneta americana]|uniref:muscleblind-like protein isoform X5 n=1 Tax=Periplaneta americana TaxID=6978 RepID=UPI0037E8A393
MAMVNMNNLLNGKDSRWLQLEVCREFQRNKCTRPDTECKFAHPPANVEVQNGRVTACYDSIKGRCNREKPPCKYFHPPQHLKDQLLINGRNHLALKNALMQQMGLTPPGQPLIPGQVPAVVDGKLQLATPLMLGQPLMATNPYLTGMPQVGSTFSPYFTPGPVMPAILGPDPTSVGSPLSVVPQTVVTQQKMARSDRLEMDMKSVGSFYYESFAFPGMVPYKRPAADKSGMPVYQPNATTYQQLMQLQQPPFVPVSCEYSTPPATVTSSSLSPATPSCSSVASSTGGAAEVGKVVVTELEDTATDKLPQSGGKPPQVAVSVSVPPPTPVSVPTPIPTPAVTPTDVAAAAAKEAAQQSYAKAVKMAAAAAASAPLNINPLMALNYTGVALNKQAMAVLPPPPRYAPQVPSLSITPAPQLQPGLLAYNRVPPPPTTATLVSPYSFLRPQFVHATPYAMVSQPPPTPMVGNGILNNMIAQYNPLATTANNNNNIIAGVTLQPYKKMKTT